MPGWFNAKTWLGGLPRLGPAAWPRGQNGVSLPFVAQIDLSELCSVCPEVPLPAEGSLAFFLGSGAVVYVPPGPHPATRAPADLPPAFKLNGHPFPEHAGPDTEQLFPYWPHKLVTLDIHSDQWDITSEHEYERNFKLQKKHIRKKFGTVPDTSFSVYSAREAGVESSDKIWWYAAQYVEARLRFSLLSRRDMIAQRRRWIEKSKSYRNDLRDRRPLQTDEIEKTNQEILRLRNEVKSIISDSKKLFEFHSHFSKWVNDKRPWDEMRENEVKILHDIIWFSHK